MTDPRSGGTREAAPDAIEFFWRCWDAARGFGGEIGGDTVQEWGEELGLLKLVRRDAPCGDGCVCAEYVGDDFPTDCYVPTIGRAGALSGVAPEPSEAAIDAAYAVCERGADESRTESLVRALRAAYAIGGAAGRAPAVPSPAPPADNLNTKCPCCNAPAAMYLDGVPRESFIGHFNHAVVTYRYTPVPVGAPSEAAPPEVNSAIRKVLEGFDVGIFVRDTKGDGASGWSIRLLPYLAALSELRAAVGVSGGASATQGDG